MVHDMSLKIKDLQSKDDIWKRHWMHLLSRMKTPTSRPARAPHKWPIKPVLNVNKNHCSLKMLEEWTEKLNCSLNGDMLMSWCTLNSIFYKKYAWVSKILKRKIRWLSQKPKEHIVDIKIGNWDKLESYIIDAKWKKFSFGTVEKK